MSDSAPEPPTRVNAPLSGWVGYALAVAAVAVATAVRLALDPILGNNYPFATYFGAVAVVAWGVRTRPSAAALLLSGLVSLYLFLPPRHSFAPSDPGVVAGLGLFLAVGGVMVAMGHARRVALERAERLLAEAVVRRDEVQRAAEAEAEQRERLRTTLASIGDAVISTDRNGNVVYMNAVAESLTGWTNTEAAGEPLTRVFSIVNEATRRPVENPAVRALKEGVVVGLTNHTVLAARDGTERHIDDSAAPIRCKTGEVVGSVLVFRDVTARHRAEAELQRSEERFRATFEQAAVGLAHVGPDGRWLRVNGRLCDILRFSRDELLCRTFQDVTHPDDLAADLADVRRLVAGEITTYSMEKRYVRKDGTLVWADLTVSLVRTLDGQPSYFISVVEDITARKGAEEASRRSEERFRLAAEAVNGLIYECDAQTRRIAVSGGSEGLVGLPPGDLTSLDQWDARIHPDDLPRVRGEADRAFAGGGRHYRIEYRVTHRDGHCVHVWDHAVADRDDGGRVVRVVGHVIDLTAQKRAEDRLQTSERRLRLAMEAAGTGIWEWDPTNGAVRWSPECHAIHGIPEGEFDGSEAGFGRLVHPADQERVWATVRAAVDGRTKYECEFRIVRPDGEVRWVANVGRAVAGEAGRSVTMMGTIADITSRKDAEERLKASEQQLRLSLEASGAGTWRWEPDGGTSWDDQFHAMYGLPAAGPRALDGWLETIHPDDRGRVQARVRAVLETPGDDDWREEFRAVHPEGERWMYGLGRASRDAVGRVVQMSGLNLDVTDRKKAEGRLRESEERLRLALDAAGMGTWEWNVATGEVVWGEKTRDIFGVGADTPVGYSLFESRLHPDDVEPNRRKTDESLRTGEYENEYRVQLPGGVRWVATRGKMLRDDAGRNVRMLGVVTDVTRRKASEEERAAAERTLAALVERCPFGIYIVDADFRIANVNAGSQTGAFANVRPLIGRPFEEAMRVIWPGPVAAEVIGRFRHTLATGEAYSSKDFVNSRADIGQVEGYEWELHRLALPDGRHGVVCYYYDSTRLRQVEQALRDADRRKDVFLATLAHELRNPLAPIRNGLQVIRLAGAGETVEQARSMMDRQLSQLVRLVDDLLDISRVTSGKLELRRERVALRSVVDAAVETSRPAVEQAGHALTVAVTDEPVLVDGDLTRLAQVVSNLLTNSAKYTHRGGHIRLTARREGGAAVVAVKDDGIGIPPAMLDKVFQMFVQVDRTLEKTTGGLGIGLSLIKGLVEMHGGTIEGRSEGEGKGSEFVVRLPVVTPDAGEADRADGRGEEAVPSSPRRVLVVDDNADAADSLAQLLELLGNEVRTANDGEAGVAAAAAFRPAVVLCDIGMPKVNGYEAARRIRAEPWGKNMVLVALTGWGQEEDRQKSADAGFDHHLVKPVEFAALTKLLAGLGTPR